MVEVYPKEGFFFIFWLPLPLGKGEDNLRILKENGTALGIQAFAF